MEYKSQLTKNKELDGSIQTVCWLNESVQQSEQAAYSILVQEAWAGLLCTGNRGHSIQEVWVTVTGNRGHSIQEVGVTVYL